MIGLKATLLCKQVKNIITRNTGKTNLGTSNSHYMYSNKFNGIFLTKWSKIFNCSNH